MLADLRQARAKLHFSLMALVCAPRAAIISTTRAQLYGSFDGSSASFDHIGTSGGGTTASNSS
jgi:hypothetical protein